MWNNWYRRRGNYRRNKEEKTLTTSLEGVLNLIAESGVTQYDSSVLEFIMEEFSEYLELIFQKAEKYIHASNLQSASVFQIVQAILDVDKLQIRKDLKVLRTPELMPGVIPFMFSKGFTPSETYQMVCKVRKHQARHSRERHKEEPQLARNDMEVEILNGIFCPPEYKIKLLREMQNLRHSLEQQVALSNKRSTLSEKSILNDRDYMEKIGPVNREIKKAEDDVRRLLLSKDCNGDTGNELLIDVFKHTKEFVHKSAWQDITMILKDTQNHIPETPSIVSEEQFHGNWNAMTRGMFQGVDWSNLFAAGGCVLGCLMPDFVKNGVVGSNGFHESDIDLFIYGLTAEQAMQKVNSVLNAIAKNVGSPPHLLVSPHSITLIGFYPARHVQIVLRLYKSLSEVIIGFDVDCCSVGYNGKQVLALPRSKRAINYRSNLVDMSRRSFTYEERLYKYAQRGFAVGIPCFDKSFVDSDRLRGKLPQQCKGLTKLLVYELQEETKRPYYNPLSINVCRPDRANIARKHALKCQRIVEKQQEDSYTQERAKRQKWTCGDYGYMPRWGLFTLSAVQEFYDANKTQFNMRDGTTIELCPLDKLPTLAEKGMIKWIVDNPGRQMFTGSFHPIEDKEWEDKGNWAIGVLPENLLTLKEVFDTKKLLVTKTFREKASVVLAKIIGNITPDVALVIVSYLPNSDVSSLLLTCKGNHRTSLYQDHSNAINATESDLLDKLNEEPFSAQQFGFANVETFSSVLENLIAKSSQPLKLSDSAINVLSSVMYSTLRKISYMATHFQQTAKAMHSRGAQVTLKNVLDALRIVCNFDKVVGQNEDSVSQFYSSLAEYEEEDAIEGHDFSFSMIRSILKSHSLHNVRWTGSMSIISTYLAELLKFILSKIEHHNGIILDRDIQTSKLENIIGSVVYALDNGPEYGYLSFDPRTGTRWQLLSRVPVDHSSYSMLDTVGSYVINSVLKDALLFTRTSTISAICILGACKTALDIEPLGFHSTKNKLKKWSVTWKEANIGDIYTKVMKMLEATNIEPQEELDKSIVTPVTTLPASEFSAIFQDSLSSCKGYRLTSKALVVLQFIVEHVLRELLFYSESAAQHAARQSITTADVMLTLSLQAKADWIGAQQPAFSRSKLYIPNSTSKNGISTYSPTPYPDYSTVRYYDRNRYRWNMNQTLIEEIHRIKRRKDFSIPPEEFKNRVTFASTVRLVRKEVNFVLQECTESHIIGLLQDAWLCTKHANRSTVTRSDIDIALRIRGDHRLVKSPPPALSEDEDIAMED